ncbi:MAG: abortive infection family protein [Peptococcaceae bacterium]|jgi:hypothetical protein|nr:abortive infection family protein [Deltaproteobacteria bacterium]NQS76867.1 abortive infection family protein [Candidatus Syntrophopropionicum ammoniitolerans]
MNQITEVTRRDIIDILVNGFTHTVFVDKPHPDFFNYIESEDYDVKIDYWGRLDEITFLKRLYPLNQLPSFDSRFKDAEGDIWQHTVNNDDYGLGWVFDDDRFHLSSGNDDKYLLDFLCEILHPAVRDDKKNWRALLEILNELLQPDGYSINPVANISGRDIYGWKNLRIGEKVVTGQIDNIKNAFNSDYVTVQVDLMYSLIHIAPNSAIGKAKELIEICCKTILDEQNIQYDSGLDLIQLMKVACESIGLSPKKLKDGVTGQSIAARILGNLGNIAQGMAELRNLYGDGHGKNKSFQPLPPRYAHLAVGSSVAAVHFMWDTYQERIGISEV